MSNEIKVCFTHDAWVQHMVEIKRAIEILEDEGGFDFVIPRLQDCLWKELNGLASLYDPIPRDKYDQILEMTKRACREARAEASEHQEERR